MTDRVTRRGRATIVHPSADRPYTILSIPRPPPADFGSEVTEALNKLLPPAEPPDRPLQNQPTTLSAAAEDPVDSGQDAHVAEQTPSPK